MTDEPGELAVATHGLTKRFNKQVAVNAVDLLVPRGAVYGFLGPNGSGKTTTIRMLLGLIRPTAGRHRLLGKAMPDHAGNVLPLVGSLVEGPAFHPYLSGRANLVRLDSVDRHADPRTTTVRVDGALDRVGLLAAAGKKYRAYSLGMRQRLAIAGALPPASEVEKNMGSMSPKSPSACMRSMSTEPTMPRQPTRPTVGLFARAISVHLCQTLLRTPVSPGSFAGSEGCGRNETRAFSSW